MIIERINHGKQTFLMDLIMKLLSSMLVALALILPKGAFAQDKGEDIVKNTQSDLVIVGAAGLGGAILGLSTLSFYDKPSKHVSNIWMGAAIGIIAGVILVAVGHAQKSQDSLDTEEEGAFSPIPAPDFSTSDRDEWHLAHMESLSPVRNDLSASLWTTRF